MPETMTKRTLKLGDREVVRIGLGTNRLANTARHVAFIRQATDAGIGLIDTAHTYAGGESEVPRTGIRALMLRGRQDCADAELGIGQERVLSIQRKLAAIGAFALESQRARRQKRCAAGTDRKGIIQVNRMALVQLTLLSAGWTRANDRQRDAGEDARGSSLHARKRTTPLGGASAPCHALAARRPPRCLRRAHAALALGRGARARGPRR